MKLVQILVDYGMSRLKKNLDKDRFRKDLGNVIQGYQEIARRLGIMPEESNISEVNFGKPTSIKFKKNKLKISVTVTLKKGCVGPTRKSYSSNIKWHGYG